MKKIHFLFLLLLIFGCKPDKKVPTIKKGQLIMSDLNTQFFFMGSDLQTFFVIPNPTKDKITFDTTLTPSGMKMDLKEQGVSAIRYGANNKTTPVSNVQIIASSDYGTDTISFSIKIQYPIGQLYIVTPTPTDKNKSLKQALAIIKKAKKPATIYLKTGDYGAINLDGQSNLVLTPSHKNVPTFSKINITNSSTCILTGLKIGQPNPLGQKDAYISIDSLSNGITISNCIIEANPNTKNWTPKEWGQAANGILSYGKQCIFRHNLLRNIHHGIETKGNSNIINNNIVIRFAGDAIRNTGDFNVFEGNYLADAIVDDYYDKGGNHDDLYQSWTFGAPVKNLIFRNNIAINCTDTINNLLTSKNVQGIACFDGFEENWIIQNNLVIVEHPHGIALFGADSCLIDNNKIIPNPFNKYQFESKPWIMIANHKDGRPSHNNTITNNLSSVYNIKDSLSTQRSNNNIDSLAQFLNYNHWIFTLK